MPKRACTGLLGARIAGRPSSVFQLSKRGEDAPLQRPVAMQISDQRLDEFRTLYRAEFGVDLGREEAREAGITVVRLVRAVYGPSENENEYPICINS